MFYKKVIISDVKVSMFQCWPTNAWGKPDIFLDNKL